MAFSEVEAYYKIPTGLEWTATSEETDFEASNLLDGLDVTWWRATSGATQYLTYDSGVGNTIDFDYLAIGAGHNLNTIGATVTWQYSTDASSWNNVIAPFAPSDDKSFVKVVGSTQTYRAVRVQITGASAAPNITACLVGEKVVLGFADLYDPQRRRRKQIINITEGGRLAGGAIKYHHRDIQLKFRNVISTLYDKIDALWQNQGLKIWFLAWEPTGSPSDIYPVYIDGSDRNAPFVKSGVLRKDGLSLKGLYE